MTANAAIGFWLILAAKLFGRLGGGAAALETSKSRLTKKTLLGLTRSPRR